jgi:hypothetical protein
MKSLILELNNITPDNDFNGSSCDNLTNCKYYDCDDFISIANKSKMFSALHLNISSLNYHFDELCTMLTLLKHRFGIIAITETRLLKDKSSVNLSLPDYSVEHTPTESSAGGALLFISNNISYKPRLDLTQAFYQSKNLESIFIEILQPKKTNIIVGSIYRHPIMSIEDFNNEFLNPLLEKVGSENKTVILLGDFNVDLLKADSNISNFMDILSSHSFLPTIFLPTRITFNSRSLIDNIFVSNTQFDYNTGNIVYKISDHLPQFIFINSTNQLSSPESPLFKRKWSSFNKENFILDYLDIDWHRTLEPMNDVNKVFKTFHSKMTNLIDKHAPFIKLTKKQVNNRSKPWITPVIITSIRERNRLLKLFIRCKDLSQKTVLHNQYKKYRNSIVLMCKVSKKNYYKSFFQNNTNNLKKIWQEVNSIINLKSSSKPASTSISINGIITSDPIPVSNCFNNYFCSIADSIRSNIPPCSKHFSNFLKESLPNSFFISPTTPSEILNCISSLSEGKANGPYSLPSNVLKLLKQDISIPISRIINLSFSSGYFPCLLKISKVIPIFKQGSFHEVSNYRPISLLSNIEKIIEKIMYSRLIDFLNKNNILFPRQFGFRRGHSTSHALLSITERIFQALDRGQVACGVFIDLKKAFDTVDHDILLHKLSHYGVRGVSKLWFQSYLSDRQQFVTIANCNSSLKNIPHGVPQGSVLGPLLFLIYINDLHNALLYSEPYLFADDTNLIHISNSMKSLNKKLNIDLKLLCKWLNANKIALNTSKTQLIVFKHKSRSLNYNLKVKINGTRLYPTQYIKYLGVFIDENLNWHKHVSNLSLKLRRSNGALCKLRHYVPNSVLISVYHAIFASHLRYGCQIWAQRQTSVSRRIFLLQKAAIRIITFSLPRSPSKPLFSKLKILNIFDLVNLLNVLFVHRVLNSKEPSHITNSFNFTRLSYEINTRAKNIGLLNQRNIHTDSFGKYSVGYQSVSCWNFFQRHFSSIDLTNITPSKLKFLITKFYLDSYGM